MKSNTLFCLTLLSAACRGSQPSATGAAPVAPVDSRSAAAPVLSAPAASAADRAPATVPLPDSRGSIGFDDLTFAPRLRRVLVPAGSTGLLDLVEPSTRETTSVAGFATSEKHARGHEQGTTSADEGGDFVFAIDRTTKRLDVVDPKERKIVATAPLASSPDYVRWVEPTREVWVTEPDDERIEIFSATGAPNVQHTAFIKIEGGPESLVIDAKRQRAFTHLWKSTTVAVDLRTRSIAAKWQNGCSGSRGIALDEARGFLFVGCSEGKATALGVDRDGKLLATAATGTGVDVIAYSPARMHLYVPGATSATLTVIGVSPAGELTNLAVLPTAKGAHCVTADDRDGIWVCRPEQGDLLFFSDDFGSK